MNKLSEESSPYLLQHKNNPVNWFPWSAQALDLAQKLNKPIILSIGYSACHWCHVMEKECFEDLAVADLMNTEFINIKVDREERPDIDMIYMEAIHMMGLQGGWPLNVFLLPNQKPFYGGTYFPKSKWISLLESIAAAFKNHYSDLEKSANGFSEALNSQLKEGDSSDFSSSFEKIWSKLQMGFDPHFGGLNKAPKFPMPCLGIFLESLPHALDQSKSIQQISDLQLKKMALGGIFDHVEGGFARYSVDSEWFAPHFEKMLYDNGQLLNYYALAYQRTHSPLYLEVIQQTIEFLENSLKSPKGLYYSALDADSEGEEGKYYTVQFEELNQLLPISNNLEFYDAYSIQPKGNWENNRNILYKTHEFLNQSFAKHLSIVRNLRQNSQPPGLDNKLLSSWNSMVCIGLIQVDKALLKDSIQDKILSLYQSIKTHLIQNNTILHQVSDSTKLIEGFLDDYVWWAYVNLEMYLNYQNIDYLNEFSLWMNNIQNYFKEPNNLFYSYSNILNNQLIANHQELIDSVIPASNSILCELLFWHGLLFDSSTSTLQAFKMINAMEDDINKNPAYFGNWLKVAANWLWFPKAIVKYHSENISLNELKNYDWPIDTNQLIFIESNSISKNHFLVCIGNQCLNPVESLPHLKKQLENLI